MIGRGRVLVAGAGPGGLCAALHLARAGHAVQVLERAAAPRVGGGALVLWAHGTRALAAVLGVDALAALGPTYRRAQMRRWDGSLSQDLPVGRLADGKGGWVMALERGRLLRALLDAGAAPLVRWGAAVDTVRPGAVGVEVDLVGGERLEADVLIGADGFGSAVGRALWGERPARPAHMIAWVGASPRVSGQPGVLTSTEGQGRRFLHLPHADGTWWYAYTHERLGVRSVGELPAVFRGFHEGVVPTLASTPAEACLRFELRDRPPADAWGRGAVTLLGDAAHACTPDLGQGVCMAAEDAWVLADTVAESSSWAGALRLYETRRRTRTAELQTSSWLISQTSFVGSPLSCQLRDTTMQAAPAVGLLAGFAAMFAPQTNRG